MITSTPLAKDDKVQVYAEYSMAGMNGFNSTKPQPTMSKLMAWGASQADDYYEPIKMATSHAPTQTLLCSKCPKRYKRASFLARHYKEKHGIYGDGRDDMTDMTDMTDINALPVIDNVSKDAINDT